MCELTSQSHHEFMGLYELMVETGWLFC